MASSGFEIKESERQSWGSIALIWTGSMICVPALMIGGMLGESLPIWACVLASIAGYAIICAYMSFMGMQGCDTGLPTAAMATSALGEKGARYIISTILAVACIGWFGIQTAVCGTAFSTMFGKLSGITIPVWIASVVWGIIMLMSACFRFAGLKILSRIAVPLLLLSSVYAVVSSLGNGGMETLRSYTPSGSLSTVGAISLTVGHFAVGGAIAGDYCRFARSRADVVKSSLVGILPSGLAVILIGAVLSITTGSYNISTVLTEAGLPAVGLLALIFATWTTNVSNAYSGGLSLAVLLNQDEERSRRTTAIAGICGTILAVLGILESLRTFLSLLTALVPALVGVVIVDYWIVNRGRPENFKAYKGIRAAGVISYLAGALVACITGGTLANISPLAFLNRPFFIGPINGIVVSMIVYIVLVRGTDRTSEEAIGE